MDVDGSQGKYRQVRVEREPTAGISGKTQYQLNTLDGAIRVPQESNGPVESLRRWISSKTGVEMQE